MRHLVTRLAVPSIAVRLPGPALAQQPSPDPPAQMNTLEYAHGIEDNRGVYLKLGYAW